MSLSYSISTYAQLVDDIRAEIADDRLSALSDEQIQVWINRAQERVSDLVRVEDEYILGLNEDVKRYYFQDRPRITAATAATPIVVTAASHGLSDDDRIAIRGILGLTGGNGRFQIDNKTTNTFELFHFADITNAVAGDTTVTVTTEEEHGFTTGDSVVISGVAGMTDLNSTFAVTVVDFWNFTVTLTTTQTYTSGGLCLKSSTGSGTYTAGGRFWRDDEIPTFFKDIRFSQRTWNTTYKPVIEMRDIDWIITQEEMDTNVALEYTDYGTPKFGGIGMENGIRYFQTYPTPTADQNVRVFGSTRVTARVYDTESLSASVILPSQYDEAVKCFTKMKIFELLKDKQTKMEYFAEFNGEINRLRLRKPSHMRVRVTFQ